MRKLLAALTTGAMILALAACGGAGTDSKEEEPLPTAPMEVATNPLVGPLAAFLEQKDLSYAGALGRMDAYTPGETDITPLLEGISADLAAAESQLYEAITVAYEAVQGGDGVWALTGEEASGSIAAEGTFAFAYGDKEAGEGRTFAGTLGQETLTARVCQVVEEGEFPLLLVEYRKAGTAYYAQFWHTDDAGISYEMVRYRFDGATIRCGFFEETPQPASILDADLNDDTFFEGAVTDFRYDGDTLTIYNDGETYTL